MTVTPPLATAQAIGLLEAAITAIRQVLAGYPEVEAAILYGSSARGTARPDSDLDRAELIVHCPPPPAGAWWRALAVGGLEQLLKACRLAPAR